MGWEIVWTAHSEIQSGLPDPGIEERKEVEPCTLLGITVGQTLLVVRLWCRVPKPVTKTEAGKADRRGEMSASSNVLGKRWVDGKYQWELMPL